MSEDCVWVAVSLQILGGCGLGWEREGGGGGRYEAGLYRVSPLRQPQHVIHLSLFLKGRVS